MMHIGPSTPARYREHGYGLEELPSYTHLPSLRNASSSVSDVFARVIWGRYPDAMCLSRDLLGYAQDTSAIKTLSARIHRDTLEDPELAKKFQEAKAAAARDGRLDDHYHYAYLENRLGSLSMSRVQVGQGTNFILSACPRQEDIREHVYQTLLASDCSLWITLNEIGEKDVCPKFWSNDALEGIEFQDGWKVRQTAENIAAEEGPARLVRSCLIAENEQQTKEILHYHYVGWKDRRPAPSDAMLRTLAQMACAHMQETKTAVGINCKGGVGRTGILAIIIAAMQYIDDAKAHGEKAGDISMNVPEIYYELARQRGLWLSSKQLAQVYRVLGDYVQELLSGSLQVL